METIGVKKGHSAWLSLLREFFIGAAVRSQQVLRVCTSEVIVESRDNLMKTKNKKWDEGRGVVECMTGLVATVK